MKNIQFVEFKKLLEDDVKKFKALRKDCKKRKNLDGINYYDITIQNYITIINNMKFWIKENFHGELE